MVTQRCLPPKTTQQEAKGIKKTQEAKSSGETMSTEVQATLLEAFADLNVTFMCSGRLLKDNVKVGLQLFSLMCPVPAVASKGSIHNMIPIASSSYALYKAPTEDLQTSF